MTHLRAIRTGERAPRELPPPEARLWNPETQGRFQTPVNDVGIVDLDQLVMLGKVTIDEFFDWSSRVDVHHLQWPRSQYIDDKLSMDFRELSWRKATVPRKFHNWLHRLTLPPELPSREVMRYAIKAETTAKALAETAGLAMRLTRIKAIDDKTLEARLAQQLDEYNQHVEVARSIPPEFQTLRPVDLEVRTVEELLVRSRKLGERALGKIPIRDRFASSSAA